jgi:hypothetical protein
LGFNHQPQEKMMAENQPFEIHQQLRELAEENVERARKLYLQFMDGVTQAMGAWSASSSNPWASGFEGVRERAIRYAKENAEAGFALTSELAKARDLQELVTLQSLYAQKQMKLYALQTQELGRLMTEALRNTQPGRPEVSEKPNPDQKPKER